MVEVNGADIGRYVEYNDGNKPSEIGRIKSFNGYFVFVVYKCNGDWNNYKNYTGCATKREDLTYKRTKEIDGVVYVEDSTIKVINQFNPGVLTGKIKWINANNCLCCIISRDGYKFEGHELNEEFLKQNMIIKEKIDEKCI